MTTPQDHKALALKAFDTPFNRRDYAAAAAFWSPTYIQHSAHIEPGRDRLFDLIQAAPPDLRYENALAVARRRLCAVARPLQQQRPTQTVDRRRHRVTRERAAGRALGCHPERGRPGIVEERPADVRRPFPD
jgi:hypothetical protein